MSFLTRAASVAHLDGPVVSALAFRAWQGAAGFLTIVLIARYLPLDVQGCYYAFASLLALQSLSDLGLFVVVSVTAARQYADLSWEDGRLGGSPAALSRLASLGRQVSAWYAVISVASGLLAYRGGSWLFASSVSPLVPWPEPWAALVVLSTAALWTSSFLAVLEGCGQVEAVNRYRLAFGVVATAGGWMAMALGHGLWALPIVAAGQLLRDVALLGGRFRSMLALFIRGPAGPRIGWRADIWPMQWRLGIQGVLQFAATQLFVPILMYYHGPVVAGRYGMTWSLVSGLQVIALAWIQAKQPTLALLAAKRDAGAFEQLWTRVAGASVGAVATAGLALCAAALLLPRYAPDVATRLLPAGLVALLVAGVCASQVIHSMAAYVRAHGQEALALAGIAYSTTAAVLALLLGRALGEAGVAVAYTVAMALVALPIAALLWVRFRRAVVLTIAVDALHGRPAPRA